MTLKNRHLVLFLTLMAITPFLRGQDHLVINDPDRPLIYFSNLDNVFHRTISNELLRKIDERDQKVLEINSKEKVLSRIEEIKKQFKKTVGEFPKKTALNPQITGTLEKDFYTVENVVFESQPGFFVTASVFKPKKARKKKLPAILYLSGHSASGFRSKTYQRVILNLVKKGYLVMGIDPIGQGERVDSLIDGMDFNYTKATVQHSYFGSQCFLAGTSFIKYMIWDAIRAIDYLSTRDDVDMNNIGATGRSGGGTQTAWLGIFEERLKATAIENYMNSYRRLLQTIGLGDAEQNVVLGIENGLDYADLVLARAPKPTMVIATEGDFFNIEGAKETFSEIQNYYSLLGEKNNAVFASDVAGHASTKKNRIELYQFFKKHLNPKSDITDMEIPPLTEEELKILNDDLEHRIYQTTVYNINKSEYIRKKEEYTKASPVIDSSYLVKQLGIKWNSGKFVKKKEQGFSDFSFEKYFIDHHEYPVPILVIKPHKPNGQVLIYHSPKGTSAYQNEEMKDLAREGYVVVLSDMLGVGELGKGIYGGSSIPLNKDGIPPIMWFTASETYRSILGIWVADMKRIQEFAESKFPSHTISTWASDYTSIPALHLSKIRKIGYLGLNEMLYSWESLITNKLYDPKWLPTAIPGLVFEYDLPKLLGEPSIQVFNPVDAASNPIKESDIVFIREHDEFKAILHFLEKG